MEDEEFRPVEVEGFLAEEDGKAFFRGEEAEVFLAEILTGAVVLHLSNKEKSKWLYDTTKD